MFNRKFAFLSFVFLCHFGISGPASASYDDVIEFLRTDNRGICECQCLPGLIRDWDHLDSSLRGEIDRQASNYLLEFAGSDKRPVLFFFASGKLLNELTIVSLLLQNRISPIVVLIDRKYSSENAYRIEFESHQRALDSFHRISNYLAQKYSVSIDTFVFNELSDAVKNFVSNGVSITAFFMLDIYYPTSNGKNIFKKQIENGIAASSMSSNSWSTFSCRSLFFFLNRMDSSGPIAWCKGGTHILAVLDIYRGCIHDGELEYTEQLFQKIY